MKKIAMLYTLSNIYNSYNNENANITEEEKDYLNYIDECLFDEDERISDTCTKAMLFVLEVASKISTEEELSDEEIFLKKEELLNGFNNEEKDKIEAFIYACVQTMGIYNNESKKEGYTYNLRNNNKD